MLYSHSLSPARKDKRVAQQYQKYENAQAEVNGQQKPEPVLVQSVWKRARVPEIPQQQTQNTTITKAQPGTHRFRANLQRLHKKKLSEVCQSIFLLIL